MANKILIMAGGTGGHIFPALAVAQELQNKQCQIHWLGTPDSLEEKLISQQQDITLHLISIKGLRGKRKSTLLLAPFKIMMTILQAIKILTKIKPQLVIGFGGYVSGPGGMASFLLGYPLVIHEQNAIAGLTNKILAYVAKKIMTAFPNVFKKYKKTINTGNPVRQEICQLNLNQPSDLSKLSDNNNKINLLILGGSLGAKALNQILPQAIALINKDLRPNLWHQSGQKHLQELELNYQKAGIVLNPNQDKLTAFIQDMAAAYQWADLVIGRAGALTIAEISVAGRASILIPFPFAVDDHQTVNARFLADKQAAIIIQQKDLNAKELAELIQKLDQNRCKQMGEIAYSLAQPEAKQQIANICLQTMQKAS